MGKVWFSPPKTELNGTEWENFVNDYDYFGHYPYHYPNKQQQQHQQQYVNPFDRLQKALGCCGFRSPNEWTTITTTTTTTTTPTQSKQTSLSGGRLGLLAPSCCSNPSWADLVDGSLSTTAKAAPPTGPTLIAAGAQWIYYCASLDENISRIDSNGLEIPIGCQQRLAERDSRFLFSLRMRLLALLAALFLMAQVSLTIYLPSILASSKLSSSQRRQPHNDSPQPRDGGSADPPSDSSGASSNHLPPNYWQALNGAGVIVLVDKTTPPPPPPTDNKESEHENNARPGRAEGQLDEPRPVVANY